MKEVLPISNYISDLHFKMIFFFNKQNDILPCEKQITLLWSSFIHKERSNEKYRHSKIFLNLGGMIQSFMPYILRHRHTLS